MSRRRRHFSSNEEDDDQRNASPPKQTDSKDQIIAEQEKMIRELQLEFSGTLDALRDQLKEYIEESSRVQADMLERIKELKEELNLARRKSAPKQTAGHSSLYSSGPKRPRKLAHEQP
jgi:hypothetical protein